MAVVAASLLASFSVLTASSSAAAQAEEPTVEPGWEWDVDFPPGRDVIVTVTPRLPAPFAGQLFDLETAARWGHRIERYRQRIQILQDDLVEQVRLCDESMQLRLRIVEESYQREIEGLRTDLRTQADEFRARLREEQHEEFWESWGFAFATGVVLTTVVVVVLAVAFAQ